MELFPTEARAFSNGLCISCGCVAGLGLPFINELNTTLITLIILIYISGIAAVFFFRETKDEYLLKDFYEEIYEDGDIDEP